MASLVINLDWLVIVKGIENAMMYTWEIILLYSLRLVVLVGLFSINNH